MIIRVFKHLLNGEPLDIASTEQKYKALIINQSSIGWHQILKGRFTTDWAEIVDDHIASLSTRSKSFSGDRWVTGIIKLTFDYAWNVWTERNEDRHGRDANEMANRRLEKAIRCTLSLYRFQSEVLPVHWKLFYSLIDHHMEKETTATQLENWMNTWSSVIFRSIRRAKEMGVSRTREIAQYFSPTNT